MKRSHQLCAFTLLVGGVLALGSTLMTGGSFVALSPPPSQPTPPPPLSTVFCPRQGADGNITIEPLMGPQKSCAIKTVTARPGSQLDLNILQQHLIDLSLPPTAPLPPSTPAPPAPLGLMGLPAGTPPTEVLQQLANMHTYGGGWAAYEYFQQNTASLPPTPTMPIGLAGPWQQPPNCPCPPPPVPQPSPFNPHPMFRENFPTGAQGALGGLGGQLISPVAICMISAPWCAGQAPVVAGYCCPLAPTYPRGQCSPLLPPAFRCPINFYPRVYSTPESCTNQFCMTAHGAPFAPPASPTSPSSLPQQPPQQSSSNIPPRKGCCYQGTSPGTNSTWWQCREETTCSAGDGEVFVGEFPSHTVCRRECGQRTPRWCCNVNSRSCEDVSPWATPAPGAPCPNSPYYAGKVYTSEQLPICRNLCQVARDKFCCVKLLNGTMCRSSTTLYAESPQEGGPTKFCPPFVLPNGRSAEGDVYYSNSRCDDPAQYPCPLPSPPPPRIPHCCKKFGGGCVAAPRPPPYGQTCGRDSDFTGTIYWNNRCDDACPSWPRPEKFCCELSTGNCLSNVVTWEATGPRCPPRFVNGALGYADTVYDSLLSCRASDACRTPPSQPQPPSSPPSSPSPPTPPPSEIWCCGKRGLSGCISPPFSTRSCSLYGDLFEPTTYESENRCKQNCLAPPAPSPPPSPPPAYCCWRPQGYAGFCVENVHRSPCPTTFDYTGIGYNSSQCNDEGKPPCRQN